MDEEGSQSFVAKEVVACGKTPWCMQFPSPVYFARWIDDRYAVIGAGGGGRRFGMANLLAIITVDSTPRQRACSPGGTRKQQDEKKQQNTLEGLSMHPWSFVSAVDMEGNIPWCASSFLPCTDGAQLAQGVMGYLAVSHITCFTLVEVRRCQETGKLVMRRRACVAVPADAKNPDKKPIALVQGAVAVAHDEGGVHVYGLASLLRGAESDKVGPEEEEVGEEEQQRRRQQRSTVVPPPAAVVEEAVPIAVWHLPARVNDLHANRFFVPKKSGGGDASKRYQHSDYLLIAVLVQDKTLRLSTMKLRRCHKKDESGIMDEKRCTARLADACVFTGKDCRIPFSLMRSSMRLVQVFGVEDVAPSAADAVWKKARRLHCEEGTRGSMPVANLVVVVYDVMGNQSYMLTARVLSKAVAHDERSLSDGTRLAGEISGTLATGSVSTAIAAAEVEAARSVGENAGKEPSKHLALQVRFAPHPAPLVKEGVTSISPCYYRRSGPEGALTAGEGVGTAIPSYWLAGTVEGTLVSLVYNGDGDVQIMSIRPSKNKREAKHFPAIHREPISCVAVSVLNDVLTTDIAQNVVVSVLPFWEHISMESNASRNGVGVASIVPKHQVKKSCFVKDDRIGDRAINTALRRETVSLLAEAAVDGMSMRTKYTALMLFPHKQELKLLFPFSDGIPSMAQLIVVLLAIPLIAVLMAYWLV
ncbi:hypothetical protein DQ04_01631110 [Trypanosoma grayi]|uniref:hypothetical protein n=1 Tax=Trypanosoma grayi TaxID=71804 RepID=UPI0004F47F79|nr:hypothetical protein DQ04_01631110 [Trypanosoma grayi]KEG12545.1 hypothetical protein DQ04_01631110 [Trypanosoma grayi]